MNDSKMSAEPILLTSFGPFGGYSTNPSEEVMRLVETLNVSSDNVLPLQCQCLPVSYAQVVHELAQLWDKHKPKILKPNTFGFKMFPRPGLVVHLGVGPKGLINIEAQSFAFGYCRKDIEGMVPKNNRIGYGLGDSMKKTGLDVNKLIERGSSVSSNAIVCASVNPGRYLCAYSYYYSLTRDASRSLFIHIPPDLDNNLIAHIVLVILQAANSMVS